MRFFVPLYLSEEETKKPVRVIKGTQLFKRRVQAVKHLGFEMKPSKEGAVPVIVTVACRPFTHAGVFTSRHACTANELFFPDKTLLEAMRAEKIMLGPTPWPWPVIQDVTNGFQPGQIHLRDYAKADAEVTLNMYRHFIAHKTT